MKTYNFKTNLKCSGCVSALMPFMNELKGIQNWNIDLENENKTLIINSDNSLSEKEIIETVSKAGYTAESV
jgi:copper chaperone